METFVEETPNKVKKVELEIQSDKEDSSTGTNSDVGTFFFFIYITYMGLLICMFIFKYLVNYLILLLNGDDFLNLEIL